MADGNPSDAQAALVRASGFFDETYYRRRRPDLPAHADAVADYLASGAALSPGPLFDGAAYLAHYPDVATAGVSPLLHYIQHGRAEGRRNVFAAGQASRLVTILPVARREIEGLAVVVRACDLGAFENVCRLLRAIPGRFVLLVAAPNESAAAFARAMVGQASLDAEFECRIAPGGGSCVSLFAGEILRCQYLLNLCTGSGEDGDVLIAAAPLIETIVETFYAHPRVGLLCAAAPDAPYWRRALRDSAARSVLSRLGLAEDDAEGGFYFPENGAFWARVAALRPLLAALSRDGLQGDDPQAGAFGRAAARVARMEGYSLAEYDRTTGTITRDIGLLNFTSYIADSASQVSNLIASVDLVSFDVFDTLLLRESIKARSVQRFAGQRLAEFYPQTGSEFYARRVEAEQRARAKPCVVDVCLTDIYKAFERSQIWNEDLIARARELEEETDAWSLFKRPGIERFLKLAKSGGKRVIAISDSYYSAEQIRTLLAREGLAGFFDELYISSDQRARKDRGDLWEKVLACEYAAPERWLHVGDNEHSDIRAALERGLNSLHLMRPAAFLSYADLNFSAPDPHWATDLVMGPVANRLAGDPAAAGRPQAAPAVRSAEEMGFCVFGPIVFAFLNWIVNHPALLGVSSVNFLSREGLLLHRVFEDVRGNCPELGLPRAQYLYASRRAALGACVGATRAPERIVAEAAFNGTMAAFLRERIGFELGAGAQLSDREIRLPRDEVFVCKLLETLKPRILAQAEQELEAYRGYLQQTGVTEGVAAVVDIGYSATIQAALQEIMGRPIRGFYLGAFERAKQVEAKGGRAYGYLAQDAAPGASMEPAVAYSLLMEAFLIAPHGQVSYFERDDNGFSPRFKAPTHDECATIMLTQLHEGARQFCLRLTEIYGGSIWRASIDKRAPQELFRALVEGAVGMPDELRYLLHTEDNFSGSGIWRPLEEPRAPWKS